MLRTTNARLAGLRHELLAPAHAIRSHGRALRSQARQAQRTDILPELDRIAEAGQELFALIDRLLDTDAGDGYLATMEGGTAEGRLCHEIRTPLTVIKGYAELLVERADGAFADDLALIIAEAGRLFTQLDSIVEHHLNSAMAHRLNLSLGARPSADPGPTRAGTVLVVEDNASARQLLVRFLDRMGHETRTAADGRGALDVLDAEAIDVVLLDLMLPVLNGFEVLLRIKAEQRWRDIPVIIVSGFDDVAGLARCIEEGAEDYLPKPFDEDVLAARISGVMRRRAGEDTTADREVEVTRDTRLVREINRVLEDAREIRGRDKYITSRRIAALLAQGERHRFKEPTLRKIVDYRYAPMRRLGLLP